MRIFRAAVIAAVLAGSALAAPAALASGPCVLHSDGDCGPYLYRPIAESNGYTTYVTTRAGDGSGPQVLTAYSPGRWHVQTTQPGVPGSVVVATAQTEQGFTLASDVNPPWADFSGIFSSYAAASPAAGTWRLRYDVLLDTSGPVTDVVTTVADRGDGQYYTPGVIGHAVIYGQHFTVHRGGSVVAFYADRDSASGTVHLLSELRWLRDHGLLSPRAGLAQVTFGWDFSSTGGRPATFSLTSFSLATGCLPGHSASCDP
jgi:hypothetical protein